MKRFIKFLPVIVFPLFYIFMYYANNADKVAFQDIGLSLLITLCFTGLFFSLFGFISKSWGKAAFFVCVFSFLFFNFENFTKFVYYLKILPFNEILPELTYQKYKIACGIILGVLFSIFILTVMLKKEKESSYYRLMKLLFFGMVGMMIGSLLFPNLQRITKRVENPDENFHQYWQRALTAESDLLHPNGQLSDIYYIILDGYGRKDVLEELYGFDNQPFLQALTGQGMDISKYSLSNYKQTDLSISSLLNFDYINWIGARDGITTNDYLPIFYIIDYNRVFEQLRRVGYRINAFSSAYASTEMDAVDALYRSVIPQTILKH